MNIFIGFFFPRRVLLKREFVTKLPAACTIPVCFDLLSFIFVIVIFSYIFVYSFVEPSPFKIFFHGKMNFLRSANRINNENKGCLQHRRTKPLIRLRITDRPNETNALPLFLCLVNNEEMGGKFNTQKNNGIVLFFLIVCFWWRMILYIYHVSRLGEWILLSICPLLIFQLIQFFTLGQINPQAPPTPQIPTNQLFPLKTP